MNTVLMLDNCQPQFDIAKQKEGLAAKKVDEQIQRIVADIQEKKRHIPKSSKADKFFTWLCSKLPIEPNDNPKKYIIDENCIKCGTCSKVCPTGNIKVTDAVRFSDHCACCQACIHACPKHALHYKGEKNTERWTNPDVTLSELINANNQNV